jgi:hypothetical protein
MTEVMKKLGYSPTGRGTYVVLKKRIAEENISIEHFEPYAKSRSYHMKNRLTSQDLSNRNDFVSGSTMRTVYKREGLLKNKCQICGMGNEWMGKPLTLQLDHIDGNRKNNQSSNIRELCPNCHAQTVTFGRSKGSTNYFKTKRQRGVCECGKSIDPQAKRCIVCFGIKRRKVKRPSKEDLQCLLQSNTYIKVGEMFGVSDNAIRQWLK